MAMMVDEALAMQIEAGVDDDLMDLGGSAAPPEEQVLVGETSLDLEQYISAYTGYNRRRRLLYIARRCPPLRIAALKTCLEDHRKAGMVNANAVRVAADLSDACREAGRDEEAEPIPTDFEVQQTTAKFQAEYEALDASLKQSRSSMAKESIRVGFIELGDHQYKVGDFGKALKSYQRCRDYSTSAAHIVQMCLAIIKTAIQMQNWTHVHNHVAKAFGADVSSAAFPNLDTELHCAAGLAHLAMHNYEMAATSFLRAEIESCDLPELLSRRDVATYGALCALASFSRAELKRRVLDNTGFKEFLDLYPEMREMVKSFAGSKYGDCLKAMVGLEQDLRLDCLLADHVNFFFRRIREKTITQYFSPFSSVDMNKMAADFDCTVAELESELTELIATDVIQARIDSDKQILYAKQVNIRARTFRKAIDVGTAYRIHTQAVLLRSAMLKANMHVGGGGGHRGGPGSRRPEMDGYFDDDGMY